MNVQQRSRDTTHRERATRPRSAIRLMRRRSRVDVRDDGEMHMHMHARAARCEGYETIPKYDMIE
jgi:hypothetical protein